MTNILCLSGKKQSGKSTAVNWLYSLELSSLNETDYAYVDELGRLRVLAVTEEADGKMHEFDGIMLVEDKRPKVQNFFAETVWPFIKAYSFADMLKMTCVNVLGLTIEQCYGSDEQKNEKTHLMWENMPGVISDSEFWNSITPDGPPDGLVFHEPGPMSGREVMQYVGTDMFRRMYGQVWVNACLNLIKVEQPALAIISDCRFPNEVEGVQKAGGKVMRFTRAPFADNNEHESERALDQDRYDWSNFDAIIDNADMSIKQQNKAFYEQLEQWGYVDYDKELVLK